MRERFHTLLRSPDDLHEVDYGDGGHTETVKGHIVDMDDGGYVVVQDSHNRRHYIPKGKVFIIREADK